MTTNTGTGGDAGNDPRVEAAAKAIAWEAWEGSEQYDDAEQCWDARDDIERSNYLLWARAALSAADAARPVASDEEVVTDEIVDKYVFARFGDDFLTEQQENMFRDKAIIDLKTSIAALRAAGFDVVRR